MRDKINAEGILLRMERLRQKKEQKEICTGICSVSTLSKIENGKQKADPVMLKKLYQELGISYLSDETEINRIQNRMKRFFEEFQYQKEQRAFYELKKEEEKIRNSPLLADWMVICALVERTGLDILKECQNFLSRNQLGWYFLALSEEMGENAIEFGEEAARILQNSFSQVMLIHILYVKGRYRQVLEWADKAVVQALEEGNLWALAECYNMKGTVYACFNMEDLMLKEYERAAHLLEESRWVENLRNIYYNIGATYLGMEQYQQAEWYLKRAEVRNNFMLYHKFALLYCRTGQKKKAREAWERMKIAEIDGMLEELKNPILEITRMELEGETEKEAYVVQLEALMKTFYERKMFGYMMFFHNQLQNQYKTRRMYRKAYLLEQLFSDLQRKTNL